MYSILEPYNNERGDDEPHQNFLHYLKNIPSLTYHFLFHLDPSLLNDTLMV